MSDAEDLMALRDALSDLEKRRVEYVTASEYVRETQDPTPWAQDRHEFTEEAYAKAFARAVSLVPISLFGEQREPPERSEGEPDPSPNPPKNGRVGENTETGG